MRKPVPSLRRRQAAVAAGGLAAILSGGTFAVTQVLGVLSDRVVSAPGPTPAPLPAPAVSSATPASPDPPDPPGRSAAAARIHTLPARPSTTAAPRATAYVDAVPPSTAVAQPPYAVGQTVTRQPGGAILRVVWARRDMTGRKELAWVADSGVAVGDARCTQRFRFMASGPVEVQPRLLMCWRTTAVKSVYTVAVAPTGRPNDAASVAALDARWAALG